MLAVTLIASGLATRHYRECFGAAGWRWLSRAATRGFQRGEDETTR
jgi:hypothetical protein